MAAEWPDAVNLANLDRAGLLEIGQFLDDPSHK